MGTKLGTVANRDFSFACASVGCDRNRFVIDITSGLPTIRSWPRVHITLFHERRNDCMNPSLDSCQHIGMFIGSSVNPLHVAGRGSRRVLPRSALHQVVLNDFSALHYKFDPLKIGDT